MLLTLVVQNLCQDVMGLCVSDSLDVGAMSEEENEKSDADGAGPLSSAGSLSKQPLIRSPSVSRPSIVRKMSMRKADRASTAGFNSRDSAVR